jgi:hypothetical protein
MDEKLDVFEQIGKFMAKNPKCFGLFVLLVGVFFLLAAVFNWDWIFKGHSYNTSKLEGVANMWGRGFARLKCGISGIVCIISGTICLIVL